MSPYVAFAPAGDGAFDPADVVAACFEDGRRAVLLETGARCPRRSSTQHGRGRGAHAAAHALRHPRGRRRARPGRPLRAVAGVAGRPTGGGSSGSSPRGRTRCAGSTPRPVEPERRAVRSLGRPPSRAAPYLQAPHHRDQQAFSAPESRALIDALNAELSGLYPEPGATHFGLDPEEVTGARGAFLVVYLADEPVGCGAVRMLDGETAELKRMYVAPGARGTGLGRRLVDALEAEARARGALRLVLETGVRQAAALALYRACGFRPIPLYGAYTLSHETSVCLGKDLDAQAA